MDRVHRPIVIVSRCAGFAALGVAWTACTAAAQPIAVVNAGFESNIAPPGGYAIVVPSGWTLHDPSGIVDQSGDAVGAINASSPNTFYPGGAPEGNQAALIYLATDRGRGEVGLRQTTAAVLQPRTRYTLVVEVGNIASGFGPPGNTFYNLNGFPGYRIDLFAGATLIARDANSLAASIPEGQFRTSTLVVEIGAQHAALGLPLSVWLVNLNVPGPAQAPGIEVNFDHVRLSSMPLGPQCRADFNEDGFVDGFDYDEFVACFEGGACPPGQTADFNNDGFADGFDYDEFVAAFESPC